MAMINQRFDESFRCHSCGETVDTHSRNRYLFSPQRPGICQRCGAPHVFEASVRLDDGWVRPRLSEWSRLQSATQAESRQEPSSGPTDRQS